MFKGAIIETALRAGLLAIDRETGFWIDPNGEPGNQILIGLLPDPESD